MRTKISHFKIKLIDLQKLYMEINCFTIRTVWISFLLILVKCRWASTCLPITASVYIWVFTNLLTFPQYLLEFSLNCTIWITCFSLPWASCSSLLDFWPIPPNRIGESLQTTPITLFYWYWDHNFLTAKHLIIELALLSGSLSNWKIWAQNLTLWFMSWAVPWKFPQNALSFRSK